MGIRVRSETLMVARFEDLFEHPRESCRAVAKALYELEVASTDQISARAGVGLSCVRGTVRVFLKRKLIHVAEWEERVNVKQARFAIGNKPNAPRPPSRLQAYQRKTRTKPKRKPLKTLKHYVQTPEDVLSLVAGLHSALVPKRSKEEQYAVNRQYLDWLSGENK